MTSGPLVSSSDTPSVNWAMYAACGEPAGRSACTLRMTPQMNSPVTFDAAGAALLEAGVVAVSGAALVGADVAAAAVVAAGAAVLDPPQPVRTSSAARTAAGRAVV